MILELKTIIQFGALQGYHSFWVTSPACFAQVSRQVDNIVSAQLSEIVIKDMGISPQRSTDSMQLCRYQARAEQIQDVLLWLLGGFRIRVSLLGRSMRKT